MHTTPPLRLFSVVHGPLLAACAASLFACGGQNTPPASAMPATTLQPLLVAATAVDNTVYSMKVLHTDGWVSHAEALNNRGQVVGWRHRPNDTDYQAAIWDGRQATAWESFGDVPSFAFAINNAGQIAGSAYPGWGAPRAMLWRGTSATDLGTLDGGLQAEAVGINAAGHVVGYSYTADFQSHATLWKKGRVIDLGTLGSEVSRTTSINDAGDIVGYSRTRVDGTGVYATLWKNGTVYNLGALGDLGSIAKAINNRGQVVGYSHAAGDVFDRANRATLWENGTVRDLGNLGGKSSNANAINNAGYIVGSSTNAENQKRAALWYRTRIIDLNSVLAPDATGITLTNAIGINDFGEILAASTTPYGERFVLLTPNHHTFPPH